jgi:hypothetical protein
LIANCFTNFTIILIDRTYKMDFAYAMEKSFGSSFHGVFNGSDIDDGNSRKAAKRM